MNIPDKPKNMKDPVLILGKWEERSPQSKSFGHTSVDIKKLDPIADQDEIAHLKNIPYRPADTKK